MASRSTRTSPSPRPTDRPRLTIRLTRRPDASVVLELCRRDGSRCWQKRSGATAAFFAVHDLTHYAVETVLGFDRGFYGLVSDGWQLDDFGTPWPRGPLPHEALPAELIVGLFDAQRAIGATLSTHDCNGSLDAYFASISRDCPVRVTDESLGRIRSVLAPLVARWESLGADESLELAVPA